MTTYCFPVTPIQEQIVEYELAHPRCGSAYHCVASYRLNGELDADVLQRALVLVIERHEVLRTVFRRVDGRLRQVVRRALPVPLLGADGSEVRTDEIIETTFALDIGPLLRAGLTRDDTGARVLTLAVHHAITDGRSLALVAADLFACYAALRTGDPAPHLSALQYADFALWLTDPAQTTELARQSAYWARRLTGVPLTLDLPRITPNGLAVDDHNSDHLEFTVSDNVVHRLEALARQQRTTMYVVLLAALQVCVARETGQCRFAFGTNTDGRDRPELAGVVGCLAGRLPVVAELRAAMPFVDVVDDARDTVTEALAHRMVGFGGTAHSPSGVWVPGVPAMNQLTFQLLQDDYVTEHGYAAGLGYQPVPAATSAAVKELAVVAYRGDRLRCGLQWRTALYRSDTVRRFAGAFGRVLERAAADPYSLTVQSP